jgi:hypothetical protein
MPTFINPFASVDVLAAARRQYGPTTELWPNPAPGHAYSWQAKKPNDSTRYSIDLQPWCSAAYGADTRVVQSSFDGWKRFNPYAYDWHVLPVVLVATDRFWDAAAIQQGVANFRHNLACVADWYQTQIGKSLRLLEPQLFCGRRTSKEWYDLYVNQTDRYDLWKACDEELVRLYGNRLNANILYVVTQYCGYTPEWDWDAAGGMMHIGRGFLAVVSSFATSWRFENGSAPTWDETVLYALGHEMGHCLGLPHTPDTQAGWDRSIMRRGMPLSAILTAEEKAKLATNPFFKPL